MQTKQTEKETNSSQQIMISKNNKGKKTVNNLTESRVKILRSFQIH